MTLELSSFTIANNSWTHIQALQLADPDFGKPKPVHLIIGADSYYKIIKPDLIHGDSSTPVAQLTIFGWIISGPVKAINSITDNKGFHCSIDHTLQDLLSKFWLQEEIPNSVSQQLSPDDVMCEEHFCSTHSRDKTGRYIVRLPLKSSASLLGDSSSKALRCLSRLKHRFKQNSSHQKLYTEFLQEYQDLGHMIPVPEHEIDNFPAFYLPHHGVVREHSQTTKLRVVFNGSSQTESGVSLNDILHAGTKLQTEIADVLLWFRTHRFVFTTDIVKMYRQINMHPSDQDLQRIYWYGSNQQLLPYRLTTVTYGLKCAPFLVLRVLQQLIKDEGHRFSCAIPSLTKGRYVDDIFRGAESVQEAVKIIEHLKLLCMAGGFPLQKWNSNNYEILRQLSLSSNEEVSTVEFEMSRVKILGLTWQPNTDIFTFTSWPAPNRVITKRTVLSEISQLYDPLGFIAPVIIRAKIFIQDLRLIKIDWDEPLSSELQDRWNNLRHQFASLDQISIPRWIRFSSLAKKIELHGFSDASNLAMAAVIYVKVITSSDDVHINLICAKTKVAPLKRLTIPRLELTAALMLSRLISRIHHTLELSQCPTFLWTDSAVTLQWISSHPSKWKDFVRNRTTMIHENVPTASWRFVPGKENPADCATRGVHANQLAQLSLWWSGPPWLTQSQSLWPTCNIMLAPNPTLEDRSSNAMIITQDSKAGCWEVVERYSSLKKLLRITALCQRAVARFRNAVSESLDRPLTPMDLNKSRNFWIRHIQNLYFQKELKILSEGESLPKSNSLIRLTPFLDEHGLLRVGGRLHHTRLDPEFKHPYILPKSSPLTKLIIADAHLQTLHGGTQITLAYTRQSYWIIGGRSPIKSFILRCIRCARYRKKRAQQLMGQLPLTRVTPSRPFLNTGVDYAGPISIKTWRGRTAKTYKGYFAIFTCFSTSAVHLEVVTDYSTEAFLAAYKRFTSRRGICATLHSDCGTNFVGADTELRRLFNSASKELKELATLLSNHGTTWRFIPPATPHFGGKWEAAVKSTKFHLCWVISESILTYEGNSPLFSHKLKPF